MTEVYLREGESCDGLLKRFTTLVARSGVLRELKDRRFFRSKGEKAKLDAARAARRRRRAR